MYDREGEREGKKGRERERGKIYTYIDRLKNKQIDLESKRESEREMRNGKIENVSMLFKVVHEILHNTVN